MSNIFKNMLKDISPGKIEVIANDEKDTNISNQLTSLINWKIVKSKSDKHPEFGYPMGQILCRTLEEAQEHVKNSEFSDCFIIDYDD